MNAETKATLLAEVERFLKRRRMAPTTFGGLAAGNRHFVQRLREGGDNLTSTVDKVRLFMKEWKK